MTRQSKFGPWVRQILAAGCLIVGGIAAPAMAQEGDGGNMYHGENAGIAGCPTMVWSVKRVGNPAAGALAGVAWYQDMSGISVGRGQIAADGKFSFTLTSVQGNGPTGTAMGTSVGSELNADLDGPGCAKTHVRARVMTRTPPGSG